MNAAFFRGIDKYWSIAAEMLLSIRGVQLALVAALAVAQQPSVPHGGGACQTEDDCSLGGLCTNGQCACDIWFTGPTCAYLNLQQPEDDQRGTCGQNFDSYFSWGGRSVFANGSYHLFASFMCDHQSLSRWTTVSSSAHFVAATPDGQFSWAPADCNATTGICAPVIQPWSHNTVIVENLPGQSPQYLMWHIGNGVAPAADWYPCYNMSEAGQRRRLPQQPQPPQPASAPGALHAGFNGGIYVQTSDSVDGPWTPLNNNSGVVVDASGAWPSTLAGNPAPLILENGTTLLYFTGAPCPPGSGNNAPNCIALAVGDSWRGPFTMRGATRPITYPESEDPFVFRDQRGNFHLLTNVNTYHARCKEGVPCGGHAWSRDGLSFTNVTIGAFGPVITFTNGSIWYNAYVERPLVTFNADGTPLAFHVGMGRSQYFDSCNWVQLFCTPGATNCGPTFPPPPRTVQLRNGGQCLMFNSSAFPCSGTGNSVGCPVLMGPCTDPGAVWLIPPQGAPGSFTSQVSKGAGQVIALDVDCNSPTPHTLVKALSSSPATLTFDDSSGTIAFTSGMCLNTGQGPARPPCGPGGEVWLPNQIQLAPCTDASAAGWSAVEL